jgi:hypothetical protein
VITVKCHCGSRVALYDPAGPSMWFVDAPPPKTRRGTVADNGPSRRRREVVIVFKSDGTFLLGFDRGDPSEVRHPTNPSASFDEFARTIELYACCQGAGCRTLRYNIGQVRDAAIRADRRQRTSAQLDKPATTLTLS